MMNGKKIALVLGGGGARGLAQIGVLKVLESNGLKFDMIVGASMGAIIGSFYSLGFGTKKIEKIVLDFDSKMRIAKMLDLSILNGSIMKGNKAYAYLENMIGDAKIEDAKIPLTVVATNLYNGKETHFKKGKVIEIIRASSCVPGVFPPVKIGDDYFIDGGVTNPTPLDVAKEAGADIIIVVDLIHKRSKKRDHYSIFNILMLSYDIIRNQGIEARLKGAGDEVIILRPEIRSLADSFKFHNMGKFIKSGEKAAKEKIEEIMEMIER